MFQSGLQEIIQMLYAPDPYLSAQARQELVRLGRWDLIKKHHSQTYDVSKEVHLILNKTKQHANRYSLVSGGGGMGSYGDDPAYPTYLYAVVSGVNMGGGYQGYMNITSFLKTEGGQHIREAQSTLRRFLIAEGFDWYLREIDLGEKS